MFSIDIDTKDSRSVNQHKPEKNVNRIAILAPNDRRQGEGGLRKQGIFKSSLPEKPLVSILTVVFNGVGFIEDTILSIISQDYENLEFIIIDGGSIDGTVDIIKKHEHAIDYWISEPDKGISDAFNKALILTMGDYVNFQGAGDYLLSDSVVSEMMQGVDADNDMLVCGRIQRVSECGKQMLWVAPKRYTGKFDKRSLLFRMSLPHQALFTHKKMFERYGLFDVNNSFCMDYEHLLRAYKNFPKVTLKNILFSAWREGGVGMDRTLDVLKEYGKIKMKNNVAPRVVLMLIERWILFKYYIKRNLVFFRVPQ
ncbi:MAG TPA: glycosyl transferase [Fibrobacteres bacterium]|nr:glycosyl transferase [Fibrobacterota bacterium]